MYNGHATEPSISLTNLLYILLSRCYWQNQCSFFYESDSWKMKMHCACNFTPPGHCNAYRYRYRYVGHITDRALWIIYKHSRWYPQGLRVHKALHTMLYHYKAIHHMPIAQSCGSSREWEGIISFPVQGNSRVIEARIYQERICWLNIISAKFKLRQSPYLECTSTVWAVRYTHGKVGHAHFACE